MPSKTFDTGVFRTMMQEDGLSQYTDKILAMLQNSIRIEGEFTDEATISVGASKLCGSPDLPPAMEWPWSNPDDESTKPIREAYAARLEALGIKGLSSPPSVPLVFLAQFNLAEIAALDMDNRLPHSGMLYFFYDAENQAIPAEDPTCWRVIYYNGDLSQLERRPTPDAIPERSRFQAQSVTFYTEQSLPNWEMSVLESLGMSREEIFRYSDILEQLLPDVDEDSTTHRLLGYPNCVQNDVFVDGMHDKMDIDYEDPKLIEEAEKWALLFQMDSIIVPGIRQPGPMWGDAGKLYFIIPKTALAGQDFGKVWLVEQCG